MGNKNKKGRNRQKPQTKQGLSQAQPRQGIWRWLQVLSPTGWVCASVSLALALVGSYYLLRPQIEVEPDTAIDPKQPITTPFRITNRGVLPIYKVRKWCAVHRLETAQDIPQRVTISDMGFLNATEQVISRLDAGESTSVSIQTTFAPFQFIAAPYVSGDIEVMVEFNTAITGTHEKRHYRFETRKDIKNEIGWYHKASSE